MTPVQVLSQPDQGAFSFAQWSWRSPHNALSEIHHQRDHSMIGCTPQVKAAEITPTPALPIRILFIGNSLTYYSQGVDSNMKRLAASANPPRTIETGSVTLPDFRLKDHWEDLLTRALKAVQEGNWDVVVSQEGCSESGLDISEQEFYEYTCKFDEEIKKISGRDRRHRIIEIGVGAMADDRGRSRVPATYCLGDRGRLSGTATLA